jgi:hypothetical protein
MNRTDNETKKVKLDINFEQVNLMLYISFIFISADYLII